MKIGDKVKMSDRNLNHLGNGVCAYSGMEGIVTDIWEDNAFALRCETSILVVPMRNAFKNRIRGVWIWLNGELVFHKSKPAIPTTSPKKWYQWFIPQSIMK